MSRIPRGLVVAAVFLLGLAAGGVIVGALSARASRLFIVMSRFRFEVEQADRFAEALRRTDIDMALVHAGCALQTDGPTFDPSQNLWNPFFPLAGLFVGDAPRFGADNEGYYRAVQRARFAVALEKLGRVARSKSELDAAARLGEDADLDRWRRIGGGPDAPEAEAPKRPRPRVIEEEGEGTAVGTVESVTNGTPSCGEEAP